jgi:hypothetical protein
MMLTGYLRSETICMREADKCAADEAIYQQQAVVADKRDQDTNLPDRPLGICMRTHSLQWPWTYIILSTLLSIFLVQVVQGADARLEPHGILITLNYLVSTTFFNTVFMNYVEHLPCFMGSGGTRNFE